MVRGEPDRRGAPGLALPPQRRHRREPGSGRRDAREGAAAPRDAARVAAPRGRAGDGPEPGLRPGARALAVQGPPHRRAAGHLDAEPGEPMMRDDVLASARADAPPRGGLTRPGILASARAGALLLAASLAAGGPAAAQDGRGYL